MKKTFEQLFKELPYSEIDVKLEISSNGFNIEIGYVTEGVDGWGNNYHLTSGITGTVDDALQVIKEDLEARLKQLEEDI